MPKYKAGDKVKIKPKHVLIQQGYPALPPCHFLESMAGTEVKIDRVLYEEAYVAKGYQSILFYDEDIQHAS